MHQLVLSKATKFLVAVLLTVSTNMNAAAQIGGVFEQSGKPGSITRTSGQTLTALLDAGIQSYDNVETENGRLKIQFVDETQISLTEHTLVEITEYVYDPNPSNSKMAMNFVQGTARFATGGLGLVPRENIQIQTPTASIGIRGTDFTTTVDELGRSLVILLPDANCTDKVKLEEGCKPSGSISITNDGGEVLLTEAYQAVMVSTFETPPTNPVILADLNLNMIDNMFIVSQPGEVQQAVAEQEEESQGVDLLAFNDLDVDFLDENLLPDDDFEEYDELSRDFLNVDYLVNLLDVIDNSLDMDPIKTNKLNRTQAQDSNIKGTLNPGFDPVTQYNTIIEEGSDSILFLRIVDGQGKISLRIPAGANAKIETEVEPTKSIICVNDCSSINIYIRQNNG